MGGRRTSRSLALSPGLQVVETGMGHGRGMGKGLKERGICTETVGKVIRLGGAQHGYAENGVPLTEMGCIGGGGVLGVGEEG